MLKIFQDFQSGYLDIIIKVTGPLSYQIELNNGVAVHRHVDGIRHRGVDTLLLWKLVRTLKLKIAVQQILIFLVSRLMNSQPQHQCHRQIHPLILLFLNLVDQLEFGNLQTDTAGKNFIISWEGEVW